MRSMRLICATLAGLALCSFAHADSITTYDFSNTVLTENKNMTNTGTITGAVTIDTTTDAVTAGDFTATYDVGATDYSFTFTTVATATEKKGSGTASDPYYYVTVFSAPTGLSSPTTIDFDLDYVIAGNTITLCQINTNNFTGNGYCDQGGIGEQTYLDSNSLSGSPGDADLVSGGLVATTPEPSSILLLGTGLLALAGLARKRITQSPRTLTLS